MITLLILIPLIGVLLLLPLNENSNNFLNSIKLPTISLNSNTNSNLELKNGEILHTRTPYIGREGEENKLKNITKMKQIALFVSIVNFLVSIIIWYQFDSNSTTYQFVQEFNHLNFCHFHIGIDAISLYFVLLTTFITPFCILSN